jgi:hypothetical protein
MRGAINDRNIANAGVVRCKYEVYPNTTHQIGTFCVRMGLENVIS